MALAHVYVYLERRLLAQEARVGMKIVMTTVQHTAAHDSIQQHTVVAHSMPTSLPNKPDHYLPQVIFDI